MGINTNMDRDMDLDMDDKDTDMDIGMDLDMDMDMGMGMGMTNVQYIHIGTGNRFPAGFSFAKIPRNRGKANSVISRNKLLFRECIIFANKTKHHQLVIFMYMLM
jgi:hypothetical protein